jgi:hypothetical protein
MKYLSQYGTYQIKLIPKGYLTGHWGQQFLFAIFGTYGRYVPNVRGTFVDIFKSKVNPP